MDLRDLVQTIGYQLTAFIGSTDIPTVVRWLHDGVPNAGYSRMQAALYIAKPIERVESDLVAQGFLIEEMSGIAPYRCAAEMLRAADVRIARAVLTERVRKEFLENVAADLEGVELRLRQWISKANLPPKIGYSVHLSTDRNRLWLQLIHAGFPLDRQRQWDRGEDWPDWDDIIREIPEIATARTGPDLMTGFPFKYLRRFQPLSIQPNSTRGLLRLAALSGTRAHLNTQVEFGSKPATCFSSRLSPHAGM